MILLLILQRLYEARPLRFFQAYVRLGQRRRSKGRAFDAFQLQYDSQRGRHLGHILLALSGAFEQPGQLPPSEFRAVFLGQVFLDQDPDVGKRRKLHDVGDDDLGAAMAATSSGRPRK